MHKHFIDPTLFYMIFCPIWLPLFSLIFIATTIQYTVQGFESLGHEQFALTTRPWLFAMAQLFT
jgi:hypothetical protein